MTASVRLGSDTVNGVLLRERVGILVFGPHIVNHGRICANLDPLQHYGGMKDILCLPAVPVTDVASVRSSMAGLQAHR